MGRAVDALIGAIERSTGDKGRAIAIAKSRGWIAQAGRHLKATQKTPTPGKKKGT